MSDLTQNLDVIILAAGQGTRMKSATIKILHRAAGRPIIDYVLDLAAEISSHPPVMVVGHQREAVQKAVGDRARFAVAGRRVAESDFARMRDRNESMAVRQEGEIAAGPRRHLGGLFKLADPPRYACHADRHQKLAIR